MFSVSGLMKNFLDHVAYNCHRPKYFRKKAYLISSCTKWQEKTVFTPMETWASGAGFLIAGKLYIEMLPFPLNEIELDKKRKKIKKAANDYYKKISNKNKINVDIGSVIIHHVFRTLSKIAPGILKADYKYFSKNKAYEKKDIWYIPAKVSFLKYRFAHFIERIIEKEVSKIVDHEKMLNHDGEYRNRL